MAEEEDWGYAKESRLKACVFKRWRNAMEYFVVVGNSKSITQ